jgi:hypothetical protein
MKIPYEIKTEVELDVIDYHMEDPSYHDAFGLVKLEPEIEDIKFMLVSDLPPGMTEKEIIETAECDEEFLEKVKELILEDLKREAFEYPKRKR